jgi:DNA-directed RNA polymerase subunit RPC12/RpoP
MSRIKVCPMCGARKALPMVYGLPNFADFGKGKERDCIYMGCCMPANYKPMYRCMNCGQVLTEEEVKDEVVNDE